MTRMQHLVSDYKAARQAITEETGRYRDPAYMGDPVGDAQRRVAYYAAAVAIADEAELLDDVQRQYEREWAEGRIHEVTEA